MAGRFSSLTTRGRAFLAAGIAAAVCALALGQNDMLRVAIFLIALPVVTVLVVARTRYRIAATRSIEPVRVPVGKQATVRLHLENVGRMPTGLLLLEDQVPYVLGARPRFVLDRMSARWRRDVAYPVRSDVRGKFTIGPLTLRVTDPFGLVELTRAFKTRDVLLVTPEVHPLPYVRLGGEWAASGESRPRAATADGEEDITVREYRFGDDLRRVHWRSSARRGELMVRREEQPWQSRATVFLDTRRIGHRGTGPASSFEWAVSGAASIGTHLLHRGYSVRLATDVGASFAVAAREASPSSDGEGLLLDALAVVGTSSVGQLTQLSLGLPHDGSHGLLIAMLGVITPAEAEAMVRIRQRATNAFAIVIDTPSWAIGKERSPELVAEQLAESVRMLRQGGWRVITVSAGAAIGSVWSELLLAQRVEVRV
ncbi:DUF58 domain-containing protein [Tenggerimyces flavus]|uniref:DUF58 domain-containing protein n=1 Tax=Tenggerimyces flavus TaxID=1708749 RepID=A0ABV7Y4W2_9ACTN|nr:DUF58 domain-containing protein [Tenggerimyces flavus]MBM7788606.1 uncharacterized protein (DUF58 family) [Tenggerimyces flavus]